jgi:ABC-2 type transport system permease protein
MMAFADRLLNIPMVRKSNGLRTFVTAAWLGWQIESNWADPFLFAVYSIARPLASVLILIVMYGVITKNAFEQPLFAYIFLGNALYILVGQVMTGTSWAVIDDREHYRTMKQLYTTPMNAYSYMLGRGMAKLIVASVSVIITIVFGVIAFKLPLHIATINWGLFFASTFLGILCMASLGIILGGMTLSMARHFWALGEAIGTGLYMFTGAIFPLDVLPAWLRPIGFAFPITYWLELARRALLGDAAKKFPTLARFSDMELMGILAAFTVVLVIFSAWFFQNRMNAAREKGMLDMETSY